MVGKIASACLKLFFVYGTVQQVDFWILVDSGPVLNIIAKEALTKLPFKSSIIDRSDVHVVGGSGDELTVM